MDIPRRSPIVHCTYFQSYCGAPFFKRAFCLYPPQSASKILIHYVGKIDLVDHKPHGNRVVNKEKKHVMTAKSQLQEQKNEIKNPPNKVYKKIISKTDVHPALSLVMEPRDKKQVANTIRNERERRLVSSDDIIGLYILNSELNGFVEMLELLPDFFTILYGQESVEIFQNIVDKTKVVMFYDTTFNLGDFYLSLLSYQHSFFNPSPVIPLFFLIHSKRTERIHTNFFKHINENFPFINGQIIITDRESAITNSIKKVLQKTRLFYCWNHIQQDVKNWVIKQKNMDISDVKVYVNHVWDLLDSDNSTSFESKFDQMAENWTENFKRYFINNLKKDILISAKWELLNNNIYTPRSGITTNAAESLNAVLKRFLENTEVSAQVLALTLYQLDLYYRKEILRGMCSMGNYNLKKEFLRHCLEPSKVEFPEVNIELEKLPYIFFNKDFPKKNTEEMPYTNYGIAKWLVMQNKVRLVPEEQVFIISGLNNKYLVKLHPTESCSCLAKRFCQHIDAAKISIGISENRHNKIKLSTL